MSGKVDAAILGIIVAIVIVVSVMLLMQQTAVKPQVCGDGSCSGTEECSNCPSDCGQCSAPTAPYCGDGTCNSGEDCATCSADCGQCPIGPTAPYCGDGTCNSGETCSSCQADCGQCPSYCGDGTCDSDETCTSCSQDCGTCPPAGNVNCRLYQAVGSQGDDIYDFKCFGTAYGWVSEPTYNYYLAFIDSSTKWECRGTPEEGCKVFRK